MIVNPFDYLTKVFPATTVRSADGTYKNDVFPFPTQGLYHLGREREHVIFVCSICTSHSRCAEYLCQIIEWVNNHDNTVNCPRVSLGTYSHTTNQGAVGNSCLLYTSDAADEEDSVDLSD